MKWLPALLLATFVAASAQELPTDAAEPVPEAVAQACASCHALPPPDLLASGDWGTLIVKMYLLAEQVGAPIVAGSPGEVTRWYRERAPETLPTPVRNYPPIDDVIVAKSMALPQTAPVAMIGEVAWIDLYGEGELLLVCDTGSGGVWALAGDGEVPAKLFSAGHPVSLQVADFNVDGLRDLLVGDLGALGPDDGQPGRLLLASQQPDRSFQVQVLATGFGRVADARSADFDGDGDPDILVSAFGGLTAGGIHYLQNSGSSAEPHFESQLLEASSGSLQLAVADFDGDGKLDFATGLAQEHEQIVGWFGDGAGGFERRLLFAAPHPAWGFNRIVADDFDTDGDVDLLLANGDTLDGYTLYKPWHGVSWLENDGRGDFSYHRIGDLFGATGLAVADWNGDGLKDVIASSWMRDSAPREDGATPPALVLYSRLADSSFAARSLFAGRPEVPTVASRAAGDGTEVAAGRFAMAPNADPDASPVQLFVIDPDRD